MGGLTNMNDWKKQHRLELDEAYREYCSNPNIPKETFMEDGIVDDHQYFSTEKKILFIAKEANWYSATESSNEFQNRSLNSSFWLRDVAIGKIASTMFSNKISLLANAILSDNYTEPNTNYEILNKIAFINLNKRGGFSRCVWATLEGYVKTYASYISQEIDLISPSLIVCCGEGVKWLLDKYIRLSSHTKVITVYHPSSFALSYEEYLYQLECAIKGIAWKPKGRIERTRDCRTADIKGIIFDTNKTYLPSATIDMLTSNKVSAFGGASRFIDRFNRGDYVFYYLKGKGVIAAGQVVSDQEPAEGGYEKYKTVRMIVPESIPLEESGFRAISPKELKEINEGNGFFYASTVKAPYLSKEKSEKVIALLKEKYAR